MTDQPDSPATDDATATPKPKASAKPRARQPKKSAAPKQAPVVLRFTGDGSTFTSGIPNRDITQDDLDHGLLDADAVKLAVKVGNHTKVGD